MPASTILRLCTRLASLAAILMGFTFAAGGDASAQRPPYRERPDVTDRGTQQNRRPEPGVFDYYVLSLSWSPTYCADTGERRKDPQCEPRQGRPYAFVLHGLWPQFERGWPKDCRSADRGYVPRSVADSMLDIMPSDKLVFHEYRTHGTCSGLGVEGYFQLARRLHDKVKIPRRFVGLAEDRFTVAPGELMREFMSANPQIKPDMIAVQCGGPGNRLREVRICFDKAGNFRSCGHNENQGRLCSADRMYVPPIRPAGEAPPPRSRGTPPHRDDLLPGPREERRL